MKVICPHCLKENNAETPQIGRRDVCDYCYGDLHSCVSCHFYDKSSYNECREPMADRITEKEKANFCDYFQLETNYDTISQDTTQDLLDAAEALFKK